MYTGPHLIKDNLVFGYDTGYGVADNNTTTRFYPGESTENLVGNSTFIGTSGTQTQGVSPANWIFSGETGSTGFQFYNSDTSPIPLKFPNEGAVITTGPGTSNRRIYFRREDLLGNTTYTLSCWMYFSRNFSSSWSKFQYDSSDTGLGGGYFDDFADYASANGYGLDEWFLWKGTLTTEATTAKCYWGPVISSGVNVLVGMQRMQVEVKGHVTPFVNGTRSSTQSLIDLTKTTDIDVSNVSFDSTGQPTFDGTDDYLPTSFTRGTLGDVLTMIAYYKFDGNTSRTYTPVFGGIDSGGGTEFFIGKNSGNTNIGVQDGNYSGNFVQGSSAWDGNYHQIVYTYNNGIGKIYLDGILKSTGNFTKYNSAEEILIGREAEGSGYWFIGDITRACVYSKVFTAEEVLEDFNALKNRFDI